MNMNQTITRNPLPQLPYDAGSYSYKKNSSIYFRKFVYLANGGKGSKKCYS